jgi:hypothetical protein
MRTHDLPLNTWMVVAQHSSEDLAIVSKHFTQGEAEAARDKRNQGLPGPHYSACIVLEPVAQRMGGHLAPTAWKS